MAWYCSRSSLSTIITITNDIDFFRNSQWSENAPNLNPTENFSTNGKEKANRLMMKTQKKNLETMKIMFGGVMRRIKEELLYIGSQ